MGDMVGIIFMLVGTIIPVAAVGVIIYVIINNIKNKDAKFKLSTKFLLQVYLYVLSLLTLAIAVVGGVTAIKAGLSYPFGIPFSYTLYKANTIEETRKYDPTITEDNFEICNDGEPLVLDENTYCFNEQRQVTDLLNGLTIFVSMVILFAIHQYALSKIKKGYQIKWLYKVYTFISLILYSIAGLVSIPMSIYQITNYLIADPSTYSYNTPEAPATAIAIVLLTVPLWILFLNRTINIKEKEE
jgi:hypothetical protein